MAMVWYIMLYNMIPTFESVDQIIKCDNNILMNAAEQHCPVVLFIMTDRVVQTFESVD